MPTLGVYFLFNKEELIYIGRSVCVLSRMYSHLKDKKFDSYSFIECETEQECKALEAKMIRECNPKLNKCHIAKDIDKAVLKNNEMIRLCKKEIEKLHRLRDFYNVGEIGPPPEEISYRHITLFSAYS